MRGKRSRGEGGATARRLGGALAILAAAGLALAPGALAGAVSDEEELVQFGEVGTGAGQLQVPLGVAADPVTGHVSIVEEANNRISEFTPWGEFVRALGWDVAPGAVNEQQEVRVRAASGQFRLGFEGEETADLPFDAGAAEVQAALEALAAIGAGDVSVTETPGTTDGKSPFVYVVAFTGALAATDVEELGALDGTTPLGGGVPATEREARTRADGHTATAGLEACTAELGCQAGSEGGGAGQMARPRDLAVDAEGSVYVREISNRRVQRFDSAGRFVWMAGGEVNKTKSGEGGTSESERSLCTAASGDECGVGIAGAGERQFGTGNSGGLALCGGTIYAADKERIQRLDPASGEFTLPPLPVAGETVQRLACDPTGARIYATYEPKADVHRLSAATGEEVGTVKVPGAGAIATDSEGDLFAVSELKVALEFDAAGAPLEPPSCCEVASSQQRGLGVNGAGTLYVAYNSPGGPFARAYGPPPVTFEAPPPAPPEVEEQFATSVRRDGATVRAQINPNFFTDTRYYVQYGTGECQTGGCGQSQPLAPGELLTAKAVKAGVATAPVLLEGLEPATTYNYRFVAVSSGGGPVYGTDPDGGGPEEASEEAGGEASFTTYPEPAPVPPCPNDALRTGPSGRLPECRAFEMVSPVEKNNGDIKTLLDIPAYNTALSQSAASGERFTYSSYRGFDEPQGSPYTAQYLAARDPGAGWGSEALNAAQSSQFSGNVGFDNQFKAFSEDLCAGWETVRAEPVLDEAAPPGYWNSYRRENGACGAVGYEALIGVVPTISKGLFYPIVQGTSSAGAVVMARDTLTPEAASGAWQAYYASGGSLRLICRAPDGTASGGNCSAGTLGGSEESSYERLSTLTHALSEDGSRAYWTDSGANESGAGAVYLRLNPGKEQSAIAGGVCTEVAKACTRQVSGTKTAEPSRFWGAAADGKAALFEVSAGALKENLYKYDQLTGASTLIAGKAIGVAAASEDLSRVYFVSREALAGGASAGGANLYLDAEGAKSFIADLGSNIGPSTTPQPIYHAARASADGSSLAFTSSEPLTGYDNADLSSGAPDTEVFLYRLGAAGPLCVSCNPGGARPAGRLRPENGQSPVIATAAWLPMPESSLYAPRVLAEDGSRLFFNSYDALLPRDTNGRADVYEWSDGESQAGCEALGAELYVPGSGGCLSLISTGQSPEDSELLDIGGGGRDAFFLTNSSLLPRDPGLYDVYDARELGGIAEPPAPPAPCQGEACQPALPAPNDPTPASSSYVGPENEVAGKKHKKKQKHKKKKSRSHHKKGKAKKGKGKNKRHAHRRAGGAR